MNDSENRPTQILCLLRQGGQQWTSGEEISRRLGISRAAVAKHVFALRGQGHGIESLTRRGYRLLAANDPLSRDAVLPFLQTRCLGRAQWHIFPELSSTNNEAARLAMEDAEEGVLVFAEKQNSGQGRKGTSWFSAPRGLQFSLVLRPELPFDHLDWLHLAGAISVAEALERHGVSQPVVKRPNDVLLCGKKTAGVLVISGYRAEEPDWAVLGIGCNVNSLAREFPRELRDRITSPLAEGFGPLPRAEFLASVLNRLEYWYEALAHGGPDAVQAGWHARNR